MAEARRKETPNISDTEAALMIAKAAGDLAQMAGQKKWPLLTYLLRMAEIEAQSLATSVRTVERRKPTRPFQKKN